MPTLSAIIIARNEARHIVACVESVAFCDQRIVLDGNSSDETARLAAQAGATVVSSAEWRGFGHQKNLALSHATGDWVLSIDADEAVSPTLAMEIAQAIADVSHEAYEIPRLSEILRPAYAALRLVSRPCAAPFRRGRARFSDDLVHERVICDGTIGRLKAPLLHDPVQRLEDSLSRMDRYSTASAAMIVASGRRVGFSTGILHGLWTFFRTYVLRAGFLDGREGFLLAVANAEGTYYRYMKAWIAGRGDA